MTSNSVDLYENSSSFVISSGSKPWSFRCLVESSYSLTPPLDRVGNSLLDASATMNAYDSIEPVSYTHLTLPTILRV